MRRIIFHLKSTTKDQVSKALVELDRELEKVFSLQSVSEEIYLKKYDESGVLVGREVYGPFSDLSHDIFEVYNFSESQFSQGDAQFSIEGLSDISHDHFELIRILKGHMIFEVFNIL